MYAGKGRNFCHISRKIRRCTDSRELSGAGSQTSDNTPDFFPKAPFYAACGEKAM